MPRRHVLLISVCAIGVLVAGDVSAQNLPFPPDYLELMANRLARCSGIERVMTESSGEGSQINEWLPKAANTDAWVRGLRNRSDEHASAAHRYFTAWLAATSTETTDESAPAARIEEIATAAAAETRSALSTRDRRGFFELLASCNRL